MILQGSVVFNTQRTFFDGEYPDTKQGRNQAFRDLIEKFKNKRIIRISPRITEYVLVYKAQINDDIIYCQLAPKMQIETYRLSDNGINPEQIENYPPLDVFINVDMQQFAVQVVANILTESSVGTIIKHLLNSLTKDFALFINSIQDQKEFWNQVSEDDEIQEDMRNYTIKEKKQLIKRPERNTVAGKKCRARYSVLTNAELYAIYLWIRIRGNSTYSWCK